MATANYGVITCAQQTTPMSAADVAAHDKASYVRTPPPLPDQTRAAVLAELRAAVADNRWATILDIELIAFEEDRRHPAEPRLMDEVRAIVGSVREAAV